MRGKKSFITACLIACFMVVDAQQQLNSSVTERSTCSASGGLNVIHGEVFYDENNNAVKDATELVYPGALIRLYEDADTNGIPDGSSIEQVYTDAIGTYLFDSLFNHTASFTYDQRIQQGTNDAYETKQGAGGNVHENNNLIQFGRNHGSNYGAGFRYENLGIPAGAVIDSAFMFVDNANASGTDQTSVDIFVEDASTTTSFSDAARIFTRPLSTNSVVYDVSWTGNETDERTPDLSVLVQELVDSYGAIDDLALLWHKNASSNDRTDLISYDNNAARAPRLVIYYTVPGDEPFHFLMDVDMNSLPPTAVLTTPTWHTAAFYIPNQTDCANDFGFDMTVPNTAPLAVDDHDTTTNIAAIQIDVLANDSDPQAATDVITISSISNPDQGGTAVLNDNSTPLDPGDDFIDFTPSGSYFGWETFDYVICDNSFPSYCDTATVTVWVACVNDSTTINATICDTDSFQVGSSWYNSTGTFVTTIAKAYCDSVVTLNLTVDSSPSVANAGTDQTLCNTSSFLMAANNPVTGTGNWTIVSGSAAISDVSDPAATISGVAAESPVTLRWTISNGVCPASSDDVTIHHDAMPLANAGTDQQLCNTSSFTMSANTPVYGSGLWSVVNGSVSITTPTSPSTTITGLAPDSSATLIWTVSHGVCPSAVDTVTLKNDALPTISNAGSDQQLCNTSTFVMAANAPVIGTGLWTVVSGSANISDPSSPTTSVSNINAATQAVLRWTISNGTCTASFDDVILKNDALSSPSDAGPDQAACNTANFTMAAQTPLFGTGNWSLVSGSGTIVTPTSNTTAITGIPAGTTSVFSWTVTNGTCAPTSDEVSLTNDALPTTAVAGPDQDLCNTSTFTMAANSPAIGIGTWTIESGSATITDPNNPTTTITGVAPESSVTLRWTISNGVCVSSFDEVIVRHVSDPSTADAGLDQTQCNTSTFAIAAFEPTPLIGTGQWSVVSGSGTITDINAASTTITGVNAGSSTVLRWTMSNGVCGTSTDDVTLTNDALPTTALAGPDQTNCNSPNFNLAANTPATGVGTWTVISGSATIGTSNDPNTSITGIAAGSSATLRWTISNGSCTDSYDEVVLTNDALPTVSNAGPDQTLCNTANFTMAANNPVIGIGTWSVISGSVSISNSNDPVTSVTGLATGQTATLRWTISNGSCPDSFDDIVIQNDEMPVANAGLDQQLCDAPTFTMNANTPTAGTGLWSLTSGWASITSPSSPTSTVTGLTPGSSAVLTWTVSNGVCPDAQDAVNLQNDALPTVANAGSDQQLCNTAAFTMAANSPVSGSGMWTIVSGSASISNASSPTTTVTGVATETQVTLRWTISNGVCTDSYDEVTIRNDAPSSTSNAGADQVNCNDGNFTMAAQVPLFGDGVWTLVSGTATITDANSATTAISGVAAGTSAVLRWTVTNGTCSSTQDDVELFNDALPTTSNAGSDQTLCNTGTFTLAANTPTVGTGNWTIVSGTASITDPASPTTTVTGVAAETSVTLRWTISNGSCTPSFDDVIIQHVGYPSTADAGLDQTQCNTSTFAIAAFEPAPLIGTGQWSVVSGSGTITDINAASTTITGVNAGSSTVLRWTMSNGVCGTSTDDVTLTNDALPTTALAGPDQTNCNSPNFNLAANTPATGVGTWTVISGSATIDTSNDPNTSITGIAAGSSATLRWTISNGSCTDSYDEVILTNDALPTVSNAGPDQTLCNTTNFTMAANNPVIGIGTWSVISGSVSISNSNDPATSVTGLATGQTAALRWTISNGSCPDSFDDIAIQNDEQPIADAGLDQQLCDALTFTMNANTPTAGTGLWSLTSGWASITSPSSPTSTVTGLTPGSSAVLTWTVSNGVCPDAQDAVNLQNDALPTVANAGSDQQVCNTAAFTMAANNPVSGSGMWTIVSGSASISNPSSPVTNVTGVATETQVTLRWTISNGVCTDSYDEVNIRNDAPSSTSNAGADQVNCNDGNFTMAAQVPLFGDGVWTLVSGTATITDANSATTAISGVPAGTSAVLRWTVTNGTCSSTQDDVELFNDELPTTSNAGSDQTLCNTGTFTLAANTPTVGTGNWTIISGTASITDPASPTTTVTGVAAETSVTLRWTISNGSCTPSFDDVIIQHVGYPSTADAGLDQTQCNTSTFTIAAFEPTPLIGTGQWSVVSGSGTITDINAASTTITGVNAGSSTVLRWTMSNGVCGTSTDDVTLTNEALPTTANAGTDQTNCSGPNFTMAANTPIVGTGTWTLLSGSAVIQNDHDPLTSILGLNPGTTATLRWTISNGSCPDSYDEIVLANDIAPSSSAAGPDQTLCNTADFTLAGNAPSAGVGNWSVVSGTVTITNPSSPTTTVTGLAPDAQATLRWSITNSCGTNSDDVVLQHDALPSNAVAGTDQVNCDDDAFTLSADVVTTGIGVWSIVSGGGSLTDPFDPNTVINGVTAGTSTNLQWIVSNGVCSNNTDNVIVSNDEQVTTADAGVDQDECNTSSFTLAANTPITGVGTWTLISGVGTITDPSLPNTTITSVPFQSQVVLRWTITNGSCSSFDEVALINSNCVPVAVDDIHTQYNSELAAIYVLLNDYDPDGQQPVLTNITSTPDQGGSVVINNNGTPADPTDDYIDYTPSGVFTGTEIFEYEICDNGIPNYCDTAIVTVTIPANTGLFAIADTMNTIVDCPPISIPVLNNDYDPDFGQAIITLTILSAPDLGGSAIVHDNGTINDPTDDYIEYQQTGLTTGAESFSYEICDNGIPQICQTSTVTVNIGANQPPTAVDDTIYVLDITPRNFNALRNDFDNCGELDPSSVIIVDHPTLATITGVNPVTGVITIQATPGQVGTDFFTYAVADYGIPTARAPIMDTAVVFFEVISYAPESDDNVFFEGALIIDMGVLPQTEENALKPYGLVYDLVHNHNIPIKWSIKGSKTLGELDFAHNGKNYYGGPFIVPAEYRSPAIDAIVATWVAKGVVVDTAVYDVHIPVMETITGFSNAMLEKNSSNLVNAYFDAAEIPNDFYEEIFIHQGDLANYCGDLYMIPHYLNMSWDNRRFRDLYDFVRGGGHVWAACQTVSQMENLYDPADTSIRLNFLSTNGLQCYGNNGCEHTFNNEVHAQQPLPSGFSYDSTVASAMMSQWYGEFWVASDNGNERWFIPANNSKWRNSAVNVLATADTTALGAHGTKNIFGYAWDNPDYGLIMYQAGHNYNPNNSGNPSDHVTALRAFFNYLFQVTRVRGHNFEMRAQGPSCMSLTQPNPVFAQITEGWDAGPFIYEWSSTVAGTFDNPNARSTNFTLAPGANDEGWLTIKVTDACGRSKFERIPVNMLRIGIPPGSVSCYGETDGSLDLEVRSSCEPLTYLWSTGDTTEDLDSLSYGLYAVEVTDAAGNTITDYAWVNSAWSVYCSGPLPVELGDFFGSVEPDGNHLFWNTLSEINNDHFNIMRSADGITYTKIGEVEGHGNSPEAHDYFFRDISPLNGLNYYRLEQVDFDGTTDYSPVISLLNTIENQAALVAWPNPAIGQLNISIIGAVQGGDLQYRLYDMTGHVILEESMSSENFIQSKLDIRNLPNGIYLLEVMNEYHQFSQKVVVGLE